MADKSIKTLLLVAIVLMGMLLLRLASISPAQAQTPVPVQAQPAPTQAPPVMVVDNATLYVLSNNKIYVYYWDGPATKQLRPQIGKLKLMQTLDAKMAP